MVNYRNSDGGERSRINELGKEEEERNGSIVLRTCQRPLELTQPFYGSPDHNSKRHYYFLAPILSIISSEVLGSIER